MISDIREETPPAETILVVDDEDYIRELIGAMFSLTGYQVLMAKDGREALAIGRRHVGAIHLLLSDIVMPGMSGVALWTRFSREHPATKVLFISGYSGDALSQGGHQVGEYPFLAKPFTPKILQAKVREVLSPRGVEIESQPTKG